MQLSWVLVPGINFRRSRVWHCRRIGKLGILLVIGVGVKPWDSISRRMCHSRPRPRDVHSRLLDVLAQQIFDTSLEL